MADSLVLVVALVVALVLPFGMEPLPEVVLQYQLWVVTVSVLLAFLWRRKQAPVDILLALTLLLLPAFSF